MSLLIVVLLTLILPSTIGATKLSQSNAIGKAIGQTLDALHDRFPSKILTINMNKDNKLFDDIQNEVLRSSIVPVQIYNYKAENKLELGSFSAVLLTSDESSIVDFFSTYYFSKEPESLKGDVKRRTSTFQSIFLFIYSSNASTSTKHFQSSGYVPTISYNNHFLLNTLINGSLNLYENVFYVDEKCVYNLRKINSFDIRKKRWMSEGFNFGQIQNNFHNCSLAFMLYTPTRNKITLRQQINQEFLNLFAKHHNLKLINDDADTPLETHIFIINEKQNLNDGNISSDLLMTRYQHLSFPLTITNFRFLSLEVYLLRLQKN